jgi:hypothetical protein
MRIAARAVQEAADQVVKVLALRLPLDHRTAGTQRRHQQVKVRVRKLYSVVHGPIVQLTMTRPDLSESTGTWRT